MDEGLRSSITFNRAGALLSPWRREGSGQLLTHGAGTRAWTMKSWVRGQGGVGTPGSHAGGPTDLWTYRLIWGVVAWGAGSSKVQEGRALSQDFPVGLSLWAQSPSRLGAPASFRLPAPPLGRAPACGLHRVCCCVCFLTAGFLICLVPVHPPKASPVPGIPRPVYSEQGVAAQ